MRLQNKLIPDIRMATLAEIGHTGLKNFRSVTVADQFAGRASRSTIYRFVKMAVEDIRSGELRNFHLPHQSAAERIREALNELDAALRRVALEMGNLARTQDVIISEILTVPSEVQKRILELIHRM